MTISSKPFVVAVLLVSSISCKTEKDPNDPILPDGVTTTPSFTLSDDPWRGCWRDVEETEWHCSDGCAFDDCNTCCENPDEGTRTCTVYECKEHEE